MPLPLLPLLSLLVFMSLFLILLHRTHLLMTLLTLEVTILFMTLLISSLYSMATQPNLFMIIIILTLAACEAALGLALLTAMARSHGSDHVSCLTINKC